ncbi:RNA-binding protein 28-like [Panonychus citri]|uniref:RNA-binding protein 28-like n=1 Tax=Panonychus citri TaxID=50023 RepID=UPI0023071037|nr:RNA-binding protein 28-like [Panonychus citri]
MSSDEEIDDSPKKVKKPRKGTRDCREGKTVFIKNLPFDCNKEDLTEFFNGFGTTEYCVLCKDEFGHPRGTAFAKFVNKEDAEKCLETFKLNPGKFRIQGRKIEVFLALTKSRAAEISKRKITKFRDKRNLYLAKEGLIYPDSPAAEEVSQNDLARRLQCEMVKRAKLQKLGNFVSRNRLCFHNIPENLGDLKLRKLCLGVIDNENAVITESKVIRNVKKDKLTKGTGFGFVTFKRHCDALQCLRRLNNNPEIFTTHRRPIVEFSIENLSAVRKKRNNGDFKYDEEDHTDATDIPDEDLTYMGVKAKPFREDEPIVLPKINRKMHENVKKLKERGKALKKEKRKMKVNKQIKEAKANRRMNLERKMTMDKAKSKSKRIKDKRHHDDD